MSRNKQSKFDDPGSVALKWVMITVFAILVAVSLGGCNTMRGLGGLVKGIGDDVEEAANGIQHQMAETDQ